MLIKKVEYSHTIANILPCSTFKTASHFILQSKATLVKCLWNRLLKRVLGRNIEKERLKIVAPLQPILCIAFLKQPPDIILQSKAMLVKCLWNRLLKRVSGRNIEKERLKIVTPLLTFFLVALLKHSHVSYYSHKLFL